MITDSLSECYNDRALVVAAHDWLWWDAWCKIAGVQKRPLTLWDASTCRSIPLLLHTQTQSTCSFQYARYWEHCYLASLD